MHTATSGSLLRCFISAMLMAAGLCLPAAAQEIHPKAGTTSAAFLKYDIGSRAAAMAGAFTAVSDDATALYWNPAGLAQLRGRELTVAHNESFESIRHDFAGYAFPLRSGTLAVALYGLYMPKDIERRFGLNESDPYEPLSPVAGYFQAYDAAAHVAYGRRINSSLDAGCGVKIIRQVIDDTAANGIAADAGLLYRTPWQRLTAALTLQHIGTPITFTCQSYDLPLTVKAGAAYRWNQRMLTTVDFIQPNDNFLFIAAGGEYMPSSLLALRAGYKYRTHGMELDGLYGFTAGIGFTFQLRNLAVKLDYAFVPYSVLGNAHLLSVSAHFDTKPETRQADRAVPAAKKPAQPITPPSLPQEPAALQPSAQESKAAYQLTKAQVARKIRSAAGRTTVYTVKATAAAGDIRSIHSVVKGSLPADMTIEFGEKTAALPAYKEYRVFKNFPLPLQKVSGVLSLPKTLANPCLRSFTGNDIPLVRFSDDGPDASLFTFTMDTLEPFTIRETR